MTGAPRVSKTRRPKKPVHLSCTNELLTDRITNAVLCRVAHRSSNNAMVERSRSQKIRAKLSSTYSASSLSFMSILPYPLCNSVFLRTLFIHRHAASYCGPTPETKGKHAGSCSSLQLTCAVPGLVPHPCILNHLQTQRRVGGSQTSTRSQILLAASDNISFKTGNSIHDSENLYAHFRASAIQ